MACVDPDPARRAEVARRYPWVRVLEDPAEVMADPEVEALVVASPPAATLRWSPRPSPPASMWSKPGPVHRRGGRLAEAADQAGQVLLVGAFEYNPAVTRMRELLEAGRARRPGICTPSGSTWAASRATSTPCGRSAPTTSRSPTTWSARPPLVAARGARYLHAEVEDVVFATLGYDGGVLAHLRVLAGPVESCAAPPWSAPAAWWSSTTSTPRRSCASTTRRRPGVGRFRRVPVPPAPRRPARPPHRPDRAPGPGARYHFLVLPHRRPPHTDGADGVAVAVATLEAAQRSLDKGGTQGRRGRALPLGRTGNSPQRFAWRALRASPEPRGLGAPRPCSAGARPRSSRDPEVSATVREAPRLRLS